MVNVWTTLNFLHVLEWRSISNQSLSCWSVTERTTKALNCSLLRLVVEELEWRWSVLVGEAGAFLVSSWMLLLEIETIVLLWLSEELV